MEQKFQGFGKLLHGGDYNPEQWLDYPEILEKDIEYMKEAHINVVSLGIFAWASLEPEEGKYEFSWLEERINTLYENGISVFLSTPSGGKPKWMSDKYPEILRVDETRHRDFYGFRHNHCYTSPVYREKVRMMNMELARRFGNHPAVLAWHISNEYGGECHCPLCQKEFQSWLKERYGTIEALNNAWYTRFWSHTYQSFEQIESPSSRGESFLHGLTLDWKRFVTERTADFAKWEIKALRDAGSDKPATINMMYDFQGLNYHKFTDIIDFVSWDNYPVWYKKGHALLAMDSGMQHDMMRSLMKQPFLLMESCPTSTNWQSVSKLKEPGLLEAASLQAVAHGSESVLYFQIRQSRGSYEKFHGAVIAHNGRRDTRVFKEVEQVGSDLEMMISLAGSITKAKIAIVCDQESRWAMEDSAGPRNKGLHYKEAVEKSYYAFRKAGFDVDFVDMETDYIEEYQVIAAPMLYMFRCGFEKKLRSFVENGGILLMTYWSGIVDETDLCYLDEVPHGLTDVFGVYSEEIDGIYDGMKNCAVPTEGNSLELEKTYTCEYLCDLVNTGSAEVLMTYGKDFYAGKPVLTCNRYGKGKAYYICADMEQAFYDEVYSRLIAQSELQPIIPGLKLPAGVEITSRENEQDVFVFVQNYLSETVNLVLPGEYELIFGEKHEEIKPLETMIFRRKK